MNKRPASRAIRLGLSVALLAMMLPAGVSGSNHKVVDETALIPLLSPTFVPWDCKLKLTGPVCTGERHQAFDWEVVDDLCDVPVWTRYTESRHQTRYYDHDNRWYYGEFRTVHADHFSTSPTGAAAAAITSNIRFFETFDIPGDTSTRTITSYGVLWDIRAAQGPALWRVVGSMVEPYDGPPTFTGHVTANGVTTRYKDTPLEDFFSEEAFFGYVCQATTAG